MIISEQIFAVNIC